jgi:hypothetical protein
MWDDFFKAGGFGMYPPLIFGFLLLAAVALDGFGKEPRFDKAISRLNLMVITSGVLGSLVGICNSIAYAVRDQPVDKLVKFIAAGTQESLHCIVLALILVLLANLAALIFAARRGTGTSTHGV